MFHLEHKKKKDPWILLPMVLETSLNTNLMEPQMETYDKAPKQPHLSHVLLSLSPLFSYVLLATFFSILSLFLFFHTLSSLPTFVGSRAYSPSGTDSQGPL